MAAQQRAVNILPRNNNVNVNANINNNNNNNAVALQAAAALRARGRPQTVTKPSPSGTILRGGTGVGGVAGMGMGGVGNANLASVVSGMAGQQNNFKSQLPSGNMLQNNLQFAAAALAAAGNQFLQQVLSKVSRYFNFYFDSFFGDGAVITNLH